MLRLGSRNGRELAIDEARIVAVTVIPDGLQIYVQSAAVLAVDIGLEALLEALGDAGDAFLDSLIELRRGDDAPCFVRTAAIVAIEARERETRLFCSGGHELTISTSLDDVLERCQTHWRAMERSFVHGPEVDEEETTVRVALSSL
jgi:hypothetical protein